MARPRRQPVWHAVAVSVAGSGHRARGLPCQDASDVVVLPDGTLLAAVADGAGSAPCSAEGARLAVGTALHVLWDALDDPGPHDVPAALTEAFRAARDVIAEVAAAAGRPARDYAATLLVAVAAADALHVAQTGDGAIVVRDAAGGLAAATLPQNGEYANETFFVTTPGGDGPRFRATLPAAAGLALTTDGLLPIAVDLATTAPHAPFFAPLLAYVAAEPDDAARGGLARFLAADRVASRVDDDLTLVLAVPRAAADPPPEPDHARHADRVADRAPRR